MPGTPPQARTFTWVSLVAIAAAGIFLLLVVVVLMAPPRKTSHIQAAPATTSNTPIPPGATQPPQPRPTSDLSPSRPDAK